MGKIIISIFGGLIESLLLFVLLVCVFIFGIYNVFIVCLILLISAFVLFVLFIIVVVNIDIIKSIKSFQTPEKILFEVDGFDDQKFQDCFNDHDQWAEENGFIHDCYFLAKGVNENESFKCSAWWSQKESTWTLIYFNETVLNFEFVTNYAGGINVTTSSTKDSMMFPALPNKYVQAFTKLSVDDLYQKHLEARKVVEEHKNISIQRDKPELLQDLSLFFVNHSDYLMSLSFWWLRGLYWFFIRRNFKVNKPISIKELRL